MPLVFISMVKFVMTTDVKWDLVGVLAIGCRLHHLRNYPPVEKSILYSFINFRANGSPNQYFPAGPVQKGRPRKRKPPTVSPDALQLHAIRMAGNALGIYLYTFYTLL